MKCLNCSESLVALEIRDFEVDTCLECGGIWLDTGELEMLLGKSLPANLLKGEKSHGKSKRNCPVCSRKMETIILGDETATELDSCRLGHGLWFDRGELDIVAAYLDQPLREVVLGQLRSIFSHEFVKSKGRITC